MSQSVSAAPTNECINQELASLVQEADDFLVQSQTLALAEIHHDFSWNFGNLSFVSFVALSLTCLVLISSQYVISERNRRPSNR
jgi:hypothetical protein